VRRRFGAPVAAFVVVLVWILASAAGAGAGSSSTPPPTPVPPLGSPSPFPTVLSTPRPAIDPPPVQAASAILEDLDTGQVLFARHPDDRRAIASLTKIMTAIVTLSHSTPSSVVEVSAEAAQQGSHDVGVSELGLKEGEQLTVRQLLYALMLQSSNDAAVALADHVSKTTPAFVSLMNREAIRDGYGRTRFYSPNGLDDRGYSTARSLAAMTRSAMRFPLFVRIVRTKFHVVPAAPGGEARHIQNRNVLLWLYRGALGVKTGFTTKAGYCLVAASRRGGLHLAAVVLGEPTSQDSFDDAAALMSYGFHEFVRQRVVEAGQTFPPLSVNGVHVPVAADRSITAWVRADADGDPRVEQHVRALHPPFHDGEVVGTVRATLGGLVLGSVPLVVTRAPPAAEQVPSLAPVPLWRRSVDALNGAADDLFHAVFG
jgi:serine-type D-Ala-D-Ala carboxypeptidase (penicillin-binding protein 5/6)